MIPQAGLRMWPLSGGGALLFVWEANSVGQLTRRAEIVCDLNQVLSVI